MSNELIFYKTPDGEQRIDVVYQNENFWMTQKTVSELFCVKVPAISKHLKNIFDTDELSEESVVGGFNFLAHKMYASGLYCYAVNL